MRIETVQCWRECYWSVSCRRAPAVVNGAKGSQRKREAKALETRNQPIRRRCKAGGAFSAVPIVVPNGRDQDLRGNTGSAGARQTTFLVMAREASMGVNIGPRGAAGCFRHGGRRAAN